MIIENLQEFYQLLQINRPLIAIDYGAKKIGIAISNQECTIAMPIQTIQVLTEEKKINSILDVVKTYSACAIVIGLPINMDGQITSQTEIVLKFAEDVSKSTNLPIYLQDERLTTKAATSLLRSFGMKRKEQNSKDDSIAASMILETTLDSIKRL